MDLLFLNKKGYLVEPMKYLGTPTSSQNQRQLKSSISDSDKHVKVTLPDFVLADNLLAPAIDVSIKKKPLQMKGLS